MYIHAHGSVSLENPEKYMQSGPGPLPRPGRAGGREWPGMLMPLKLEEMLFSLAL